MKECVDPAFYARVVIEGIAIKVAEFKSVLRQGGASKGCGNVSFDKSRSLKDYKALMTLDKNTTFL